MEPSQRFQYVRGTQMMKAAHLKEIESLYIIINNLATSGLSPRRENFTAETRFPSLDFNLIQSIFCQMYVRSAKKRIPRFDISALNHWVNQANTGKIRLNEAAARCGYNPYKVAKRFLSYIHNTDMFAFMEEPTAICENNRKRYSILSAFIHRLISYSPCM